MYVKFSFNHVVIADFALAGLSAFSIKLSEIIPVFSERLTRFHGGMYAFQSLGVKH